MVNSTDRKDTAGKTTSKEDNKKKESIPYGCSFLRFVILVTITLDFRN
ncbi:hypothetical protein [Neobacillus vireti]